MEMFTRAIVLGEDEFRLLVSDLVEVAKGEFGEVDSSRLEEFLVVAFEEVLDAYEVDEVMVNLGGVWYEVIDGENFVNVIKEYYGDLDGMLKNVEGEEEKEVDMQEGDEMVV
jgi:hypothetical protein